jgi:hypothetical protein
MGKTGPGGHRNLDAALTSLLAASLALTLRSKPPTPAYKLQVRILTSPLFSERAPGTSIQATTVIAQLVRASDSYSEGQWFNPTSWLQKSPTRSPTRALRPPVPLGGLREAESSVFCPLGGCGPSSVGLTNCPTNSETWMRELAGVDADYLPLTLVRNNGKLA